MILLLIENFTKVGVDFCEVTKCSIATTIIKKKMIFSRKMFLGRFGLNLWVVKSRFS